MTPRVRSIVIDVDLPENAVVQQRDCEYVAPQLNGGRHVHSLKVRDRTTRGGEPLG